MTQQPPPWGTPPPPPPQPPGSGLSNKVKFWIGAALAVPAMAGSAMLLALADQAFDTVAATSDADAAVAGAVSLLIFAAYVTLIVLERTRWVAVGMLAGAAIAWILAAGACFVLLASLNGALG